MEYNISEYTAAALKRRGTNRPARSTTDVNNAAAAKPYLELNARWPQPFPRYCTIRHERKEPDQQSVLMNCYSQTTGGSMRSVIIETSG